MGKNTKEKKLTKAEQRRVEEMRRITDEMTAQNYVRKDLTISAIMANVVMIIIFIILAIVGFVGYYLVNHGFNSIKFNPVLLWVLLILLIAGHELIHGLTWSLFTPDGFKNIAFGINTCVAYCNCNKPLKKSQYILGAVMPLITLGIIPMIVGIVIGNFLVLLIGILMSAAAAGDIMIIHKILTYKSNASEIIYMDHPTEPGGIIFER